MRRTWILLIISLAFRSAKAQFPVHPDSIYTFIKNNSAWSPAIADWKPVDAAYKKELAAARTDTDTLRCLVSVLKELGDVHSYFIYHNRYYGHYLPVDSAAGARLKPLQARAAAENNRFSVSWLPGAVVLIRVPSVSAYKKEDIDRSARSLYDSVWQFAAKKPRGFIIDLRLNTGGNLYPMLAGLSALLGETTVGYEKDTHGDHSRKWEIRKGDFIIGGYPATQTGRDYIPVFSGSPVVVLTGPVTASSGSMTAIAFKGRPRTIFMGEPTARGYTTSNGYFYYTPDFSFYFATHFVADRNETLYKDCVPVDRIIWGPDDFDHLLNDNKVKAALKWLKKQ